MKNLITRLLGRTKKKQDEPMRAPKVRPNSNAISTNNDESGMTHEAMLEYVNKRVFQITPNNFKVVAGTANDQTPTALMKHVNDSAANFKLNDSLLPDALTGWYANQSFIGYQMCAILAQNAVIDKICTIPAKDAIRKGFEITENSGTVKVPPEVFTYLDKRNRQMKLNKHMRDFIRFGKIFGIQFILFKVKSDDKKYYEKPFNIDGVTKGSYEGMVRIEPYWLTPELTADAAIDPSSPNFYTPVYWRLSNGTRIHHSHFCIYTTGEVANILKPTYFYGGVSIPQKIYERVYCAESTANEAPQLAKTKRSVIYKMDLTKAVAGQKGVESRLNKWVQLWNNWCVRAIGLNEEVQQLDTNLSDLDGIIMTQYQLICMLGNAPSTKVMGTSPKGFNATGEYEEASYREELESIQENDLDPLVMRHTQCVIKSEVENKFGITFDPFIKWTPLDSPTAKELAETNYVKAQTDQINVAIGAVDGIDVQKRLIADEDSGYNGLLSDDSEDGSSEPDSQTAGDVPIPPAINENVKNLTAGQHKQLLRTLRDYGKGRIDAATAKTMLKTGIGFSDADIDSLLGVNAPKQAETTNA